MAKDTRALSYMYVPPTSQDVFTPTQPALSCKIPYKATGGKAVTIPSTAQGVAYPPAPPVEKAPCIVLDNV